MCPAAMALALHRRNGGGGRVRGRSLRRLSVYNRDMGANEELHRLIDMVPEPDWPLVSRFLHFLAEGGDPPLGDADWAAVREGDAEFARGEVVTLDELKREFGL